LNGIAIAIYALVFLASWLGNDLGIQQELTGLDRSGAIRAEEFEKHFHGRFRSVSDQDFARYLAAPWIRSCHALLIVGVLSGAANIACAMKAKDRDA
jgi:hypothetical protein